MRATTVNKEGIVMFFFLAVILFVFFMFFAFSFFARRRECLSLFLLVVPFVLMGGVVALLWTNYRYETLGLIYYVFPPNDIHKPIVLEPFPLWEEGFSRVYNFSPRYLNRYQIGYFLEGQNLAAQDQFSGKLRIDLLLNGETILSREVNSTKGGLYAGINGSNMAYKSFYLLAFSIPEKMMKRELRDDIAIKVTVLDADRKLEKFDGALKGFVSIKTLP